MGAIRILIADDHTIVREGLAMLLEEQPDMEVVGWAADGLQAIDEARRVDPDVVLLDLSMPRCNGIDALPRLRETVPRARVIVLTMHVDRAFVQPVLDAGGHGYLEKNTEPSRLVGAIRDVVAGKTRIDVPLGVAMPPSEPMRLQGSAPLSQRERQVLEQVALGFTSREIGEALGLSKKTVDSYRARVANKLDLHTRADLVRAAAQLGLLPPRP